jgi:hypothetical protein
MRRPDKQTIQGGDHLKRSWPQLRIIRTGPAAGTGEVYRQRPRLRAISSSFAI